MSEEFDVNTWSLLASRVLQRSLGLRRGQNVVIETWTHTLRLAEVFSVAARQAGIRPTILYMSERAFFESQAKSSPSDANAIGAAELKAIAACDGYVNLPGPADLKRWGELPAAHRHELDRWMLEWSRNLHRHSTPCVYLLVASPTRAAARTYRVRLDDWQRENLAGSLVDPRVFQKKARPLTGPLLRGRRVTITHPNGTNLELGLIGRQPIVWDGVVDRQDLAEGRNWTVLPSGCLIVPLDERRAEGRFVSNRPSRHRRGTISRISWTFRNGRLNRYDVGQGRNLFEDFYLGAGKERDRPALLSIGLNPKIRDSPFAEDAQAGVITLYIGHNDDFGGRTRGAFRGFALLEAADVLVDDRPVLRAGRWT